MKIFMFIQATDAKSKEKLEFSCCRDKKLLS